MNKQSEDKATSLQDEPNKLNPAKDEISEQELDKASGGSKMDRNLFGTQSRW